MSKRSDWTSVMKAIHDAGWTPRKCHHGMLAYPENRQLRPITIPGTASDVRSIHNCRAQLRRAGLRI